MVDTLDNRLIGIRDRAMRLLGFAGAIRWSELATLNVEDVEIKPQRLFVTIQRSKTVQLGEGQVIGIPYGSTYETRSVRSIQSWVKASGISEGALFRSIDHHSNIEERIPDYQMTPWLEWSRNTQKLQDSMRAANMLVIVSGLDS